jgi:hypothetical protein
MLSKSALSLTIFSLVLVYTNTLELPKDDRILQVSSTIEKLVPNMGKKVLADSEQKVADAIPVVKDPLNDMMSKVRSGPGFFNIFFIKKMHKIGEPTEQQQEPISVQHPPSLILFKIRPGQHLLGAGGSDDIDKKFFDFKAKETEGQQQQHLLGGGDDDVDNVRMHIRITGTGEDVNQDPFKHFFMPLPFFNFDKNGMKPMENGDDNEDTNKPPLIIRTDDGSHAFLSNDFGNHVRDEEDDYEKDGSMMSSTYKIKKCMMRHLLRLKASLYYRSVLHMLFISGIFMFILLITMLIVKSCRRQRIIRQHAMDVASIDSKLAMGFNAPPRYDELTDEKKTSKV